MPHFYACPTQLQQDKIVLHEEALLAASHLDSAILPLLTAGKPPPTPPPPSHI